MYFTSTVTLDIPAQGAPAAPLSRLRAVHGLQPPGDGQAGERAPAAGGGRAGDGEGCVGL